MRREGVQASGTAKSLVLHPPKGLKGWPEPPLPVSAYSGFPASVSPGPLTLLLGAKFQNVQIWEREILLWSLGLATPFVWKTLYPGAPVALSSLPSSFCLKAQFSMRPRLHGVSKLHIVRSHRSLCFYSSLEITWRFWPQLIHFFFCWHEKCFCK